jgi:CDP-glucose 4,6-dehydratase
MNRQFWPGKRVFVTGHTGFKGGWLCLWLKKLGAEVTGYSLPPSTHPSLFEEAQVGEDMHSVYADIRDLEKLKSELAAAHPDIVFHLAAQPLVRHSYADPVETYATNVMGTVHLLESVRSVTGIRAVVNVTSDKCYENREWPWGYRENEAMGGYDPYSSSKGCAELTSAAYRNSYFNPQDHSRHGVAIATARAGNVIGGGDWSPDRLVPDFMRAVAAAAPVVIRNPHAIRPWQHVLESLNGYLLLAEKLCTDGPGFSGAWNFGPHDEDARPVQWVVERLVREWGDGAGWQPDGGNHPHEAHHLKLDISKARTGLGWEPRWNLGQALQHTAAWYRAWHQGEPMREFSGRQIAQYEQTLHRHERDDN